MNKFLNEDVSNGFEGFIVRNAKGKVKLFETGEIIRESWDIPSNVLFKNIDEFLDYLNSEILPDMSIEWTISRYDNFTQRKNLFVLTKRYSDADLEISFQPIIPKHTMSREEYMILCER